MRVRTHSQKRESNSISVIDNVDSSMTAINKTVSESSDPLILCMVLMVYHNNINLFAKTCED